MIVSYEDAPEYGFGTLGHPGYRAADQHLTWLKKTAAEMAEDYNEIFKKLSSTSGRIQESGHQIEAGWRDFLTKWLPPQYEVKTRKYIVGEVDNGERLEETDIVILRPSYPSSLREKSHILASGVAAAFSVKSTLKRESVYEAAKSCAHLTRTLAPREGTARREMIRPFPYGILAHSHNWKSAGSTPQFNVSKHLFEADQTFAFHPRESLDLLCVPDLGTWNNIKNISPPFHPSNDELNEFVRDSPPELLDALTKLGIRSIFVPNPYQHAGDVLAAFLTSLYSRLAIYDPELDLIADSFALMGAESGGRDRCRFWTPEIVLTEAVRDTPFAQWEHIHSNREMSTSYGWHVPW